MQRTDANSNYNGLVTRWDKRFSGGLQAGFSYTFSKTMSDAETVFGADGGGENAVMDPYNPKQAGRGSATTDTWQVGWGLQHQKSAAMERLTTLLLGLYDMGNHIFGRR